MHLKSEELLSCQASQILLHVNQLSWMYLYLNYTEFNLRCTLCNAWWSGITINIVYSSYLCSRSTHEEHDPSTSVGVCTLWTYNVTQYNSTWTALFTKSSVSYFTTIETILNLYNLQIMSKIKLLIRALLLSAGQVWAQFLFLALHVT